MTYSEVLDEIDAYNRRSEAEEKYRMQDNAALVHGLARLINLAVWDPKHLPGTPKDAFPGLFPKKSVPGITWQESKANWAAYAKIHNAQRGGGGT